MNCPKCNTEMIKTIEERWTGKYNNVLSVFVFYDCPKCGHSTDSTEAVEPSDTSDSPAPGSG